MSNNDSVRLFVENRAEELTARGMFADLVSNNRLMVKMCWTSSSAISLAEAWLLTTADAYVALALNCSADADPREFRTPIENILSRAASRQRWHVALAIPDMAAWAQLDTKFVAWLKSVHPSETPPTKADVAVQFSRWAAQPDNSFDRDEASESDEEFAALNRFIEQHVVSSTAATQ